MTKGFIIRGKGKISDDQMGEYVKRILEEEKISYLEVNLSSFKESLEIAKNQERLYNQVKEFVLKEEKCNIYQIQREFGLGFEKAAQFTDKMEHDGFLKGYEKNGRIIRELTEKGKQERNRLLNKAKE